jgi:PBSX family phage terminase large subunit
VTTTLEHTFRPRGAALEVMRYRGDEVLLAGPAGTGKSRAALEKVHLMCLLTPRTKALIMRKTAVSLTTSAISTYERDVATQAMLDGTVTYFGGSRREPAQYRYSNGSSIALGGMDNPMKVMSTEYDVIFVQEATELAVEEWEALTTRLRNGVLSFQQLIADCNPQEPTHWLKLRCEAGKTRMLHSRHEDNPLYFHADGTMTPQGVAYMGKLDALTGVRYLRLRKGIWAAAEGVIFDEFDPKLHIIDRFVVPEDWPRGWSIDFGFVNPFVWQDWTVTPDDQLVLVREIYRTQRLVEDHARDIRALMGLGPIDAIAGRPLPYNGPEVTGWDAKKPSIILCDHDAEDRATLERHLGWPTRPANKNVSDGIQATQARYRPDSRGRARMMFMRDGVLRRDPLLEDARKPQSTPEEIPGYVWNDKGKDEPNKENDHGCDAKRYLVMERDVQPRPRVRFLR